MLRILNDGDVSTDVSHEAVVTHGFCFTCVIQLSPPLDNLEQLLKISPGSSEDLESLGPAFNTFLYHSAAINSTVIRGECIHGFCEPFVEAEEFCQNILVKVEVA